MSTELSLWKDTPVKQKILHFIETASTHVPPEERIVSFDNDGTLWCERPYPVQVDFVIKCLLKMVEEEPGLRSKEPFKSILDDISYITSLFAFRVPAWLEKIFDSHAGLSQSEFRAQVREFFQVARHPKYKVPYTQIFYQPMLELIQLLEANEFKVFITTGGGMTFVRVISEQIYGVSREKVIGSAITFEYKMEKDGPVIIRKPGLVEPMDVGPGKAINIELHTGRRPVLSGGNADIDIEMLEFAMDKKRPSLALLVHHDDAEREYSYDMGAKKALRLAPEQGWTVISMKNDWKTIFPFQS